MHRANASRYAPRSPFFIHRCVSKDESARVFRLNKVWGGEYDRSTPCPPEGNKYLFLFVKTLLAVRYFNASTTLLLDSESTAARPFSIASVLDDFRRACPARTSALAILLPHASLCAASSSLPCSVTKGCSPLHRTSIRVHAQPSTRRAVRGARRVRVREAHASSWRELRRPPRVGPPTPLGRPQPPCKLAVGLRRVGLGAPRGKRPLCSY